MKKLAIFTKSPESGENLVIFTKSPESGDFVKNLVIFTKSPEYSDFVKNNRQTCLLSANNIGSKILVGLLEGYGMFFERQ